MSFTVRSKDSAGDVIRAADQNESVDNDDFLFSQVLGPQPPASATGGMVRQWVKLTGIADATTTEFATVTTTNEAGDNDGGVYHAVFEGFVAHGYGPTLEASIMGLRFQVVRAINGAGAAGGSSAVVESSKTAVATSTVATKSITSITTSVNETSEYVLSFRINADITGATVTTAAIFGMMTVYYAGFNTAPVITSAG